MVATRSQIPGEGTDPSTTDLLRAEFPFDAPPRSFLRRFRWALLALFVVAIGLLFAFRPLYMATEADYVDDDVGFSFSYERRFGDLDDTSLGRTAATHLAEVAYQDNAVEQPPELYLVTGFRVVVEEAPLELAGRAPAEVLTDLAGEQITSRSASQTLVEPWSLRTSGAGECLWSTVDEVREGVLMRATTCLYLRDDRLYSVECRAPVDGWQDEWPHFERVLDSFRITYQPDGA